MSAGGWVYLPIFILSAAGSLLATPLAIRFAVIKRVLDVPHGHKTHVSPVPYLGGVAIVSAFAGSVLVGAALKPPVDGSTQLVTLMVLAVGLAVLGLLDDLFNVNVLIRLAAEIGAAALLWIVDLRIDVFHDTAPDFILTVVWIVGITNALNLLDNMDGLSAGVTAIAALSFFTIAAVNDQFLVAALSIALSGCALGFLPRNFHPAKIYMGDAGSLFLGFLLAALAIKLRFGAVQDVSVLVPVLVLGIALFDTTLVTVTRIARGRSPLSGGRDHTSHRLVKLGLPIPLAVLSIYSAAACLGFLALVVSRAAQSTAYALTAAAFVALVGAGTALGFVPVDEPSAPVLAAVRDEEEDGGPITRRPVA